MFSGGIEQGPFPRARIRTVDGRIVGNAYPTHHPDCRPMSARIFKAREIDTGCRYRIKQGLISPRQAWDLVCRINSFTVTWKLLCFSVTRSFISKPSTDWSLSIVIDVKCVCSTVPVSTFMLHNCWCIVKLVRKARQFLNYLKTFPHFNCWYHR